MPGDENLADDERSRTRSGLPDEALRMVRRGQSIVDTLTTQDLPGPHFRSGQ
jgi:hypothetical protein